MKIALLTREISDRLVRENFIKLMDYFRTEKGLEGFRLFEIEFEKAETNYRFKHNLGFAPKDVLQTSLTGSGSLTWNYSLFDRDYLDITTTGPCVVRAFVGAYQENS